MLTIFSTPIFFWLFNFNLYSKAEYSILAVCPKNTERPKQILLLEFSGRVHPPSRPMLVSSDVLTGHPATCEVTVNKIVLTRRGEGGRDLWNLNAGESLIFYFPCWYKEKKLCVELDFSTFSKGVVLN